VSKWLVKTEPSTYSWQQLVCDKHTRWDGVRNAQARNNLAAMKTGDEVLVYHSGDDRAVVGIAKVAKSAYPDPTADDEKWLCVDLVPVRSLASPVELAAIKKTPSLASFTLVRNSRLSVMPATAEEFRAVVALSKIQ
jgi:predicted RNA-binding protein with PUA-like domain